MHAGVMSKFSLNTVYSPNACVLSTSDVLRPGLALSSFVVPSLKMFTPAYTVSRYGNWLYHVFALLGVRKQLVLGKI